jgi:penicillin-binding protein 1A
MGNADDFLTPILSTWLKRGISRSRRGLTLGAAGSVAVFALALPAFSRDRRHWRTQGDFAVTFTDRYGNEIGSGAVSRATPFLVDEMPDYVI